MGSMKTLKFKFYQHKRNRYLKRTINAAGAIYNHCIALHKRYYRMWGKHLNCAKLQSHVAKLRKRNPLWQSVGSQAKISANALRKPTNCFLSTTKKNLERQDLKRPKSTNHSPLKPVHGTSFWVEIG